MNRRISTRVRKDTTSTQIRKRQKNNIFTQWIGKAYKNRWLIIALAVCSLLIVVTLSLLQYFFKWPRYQINQLVVAPQATDAYTNDALYDALNELILWENKLWSIRFKEWTYTRELQEIYPFISDITLRRREQNSVTAEVAYDPPLIVFQLPEERYYFGYENWVYPVEPDDTIIAESYRIQLPQYTRDLTSIDGIFYEIPIEDLGPIIEMVVWSLWVAPNDELIYLPWWSKLFVRVWWTLLYLHVDKAMQPQLQKIADLISVQWSLDGIQTIDAWSTDDLILTYY